MPTIATRDLHPAALRGLAFGAAALAIAVGALAAAWWVLTGRALMPVTAGPPPMDLHAALCFFMLGTALAAAVLSRLFVASALTSVVLAFGIATLLQGVPPTLGLNQLLSESALTDHGHAMSAQIALCLVGLCVAVLGVVREARAPIAATVASLVAAFGAMSMLGYGLDLEPLYGWSGIRQMAWPTALTVMVLSSGLLAAILADSAARAPGLLPEWLHVPAGVFTAAGGLILWHATTSELVSREIGYSSAGSGANVLVSAAGSVLTATVVRLWVIAQRRKVQIERMHLDLQQAHEELLRATSEIKTLSGLMPICAWCKSIRDDRGYWEELERYLSTHTDVLFTHGICPGCAAGALADTAHAGAHVASPN